MDCFCALPACTGSDEQGWLEGFGFVTGRAMLAATILGALVLGWLAGGAV